MSGVGPTLVMLVFAALVVSAALPSFHPDVFSVKHLNERLTVHTRVAPVVKPRSVAEWEERVLAARGRLAAALESQGRAVPQRLNPNDLFEFIPTFVAAPLPGGDALSWSLPGACSQAATASLSAFGDNSTTLAFSFSQRRTLLCYDLYLIASSGTFHVHEFALGDKHEIVFEALSPEDMADISANGLRVFHFQSEVLQDVVDFWDTALLFLQGNLPLGPPSVSPEEAKLNLEFLQTKMGITMAPRSAGVVNLTLSKEIIPSGSFLGIIRLDGLDPMIAWGMGAHTGHTTVALWMPTGPNGEEELYVTESQTKSHYWPNNFIQKTPFNEWIALATDASYNVVLLPLTAEAAAAFNETAANAWFAENEGHPYGFANFLFGWIDSADGNFPPPLSEQLVMVGFALLDRIEPNITELMWNQALNNRLNTSGLDCAAVYAKAASQNITFGELISMPELDSYRYLIPGWAHPETPIQSMVCNVWVGSVLKAGGLFSWAGLADDEVNVGETTNADIYRLSFFEAAPQRPPQCVQADPENDLCQLTGEFSLELFMHATSGPYPRMRERCAGIAPDYYYDDNTC